MTIFWVILGIIACIIIPFIVTYIVDRRFLRSCLSGDFEAAQPQDYMDNTMQVPILYTQIIPGAEQEIMMWNFTLFESKGIVVLTFYIKERAKELAIKFLPEDKEEFEAMSEDELAQIISDVYIKHKNATIGKIKNGTWLWIKE